MDIRLRPGLQLLRVEDEDTARSGAGRAAAEAVWAPALEDRRFGDVTIPSRMRVGWWFGTPRYAPFFEATVTAPEPSG